MSAPFPLDGPHFKIVPKPASDTLFVFFSGTDKTNGRFDFWRVGERIGTHVLFLNNGRNEWYQNGVPGFGDSIEGTAKAINNTASFLGAKKIVMVGVSMGGFGAVLFGTLLETKVVAFGYDAVIKLPGTRSLKRMPKNVAINVPDVRPVVEKSKAKILHIAGEVDALDLMAAYHMQGLRNVEVITLRGVGHGGAPFIEAKFGLASFLRDWGDSGEIPEMAERGSSVLDKRIVDATLAVHFPSRVKDWPATEAACKAALKVSPLNETINYWMGTALLEMGMPSEAIPYLAQVVAMTPHFSNAHYRLARAMMKCKDNTRAKLHLLEHKRMTPGAAMAYMFLSDIYYSEGSEKKASDELMQAFQIAPNNQAIQTRMVKYHQLI